MPAMTSSYLYMVLKPKGLERISNTLIKLIESTHIVFDSIAFTGMSGALVVPTLAFRMEKNPLVIRKPGDGSHSSRSIEGGGVDVKSYIIVDDFISSGRTITRILEALNDFGDPPSSCKAIFLYASLDRGDQYFAQVNYVEVSIPLYAFAAPDADSNLINW